MLNFVGLKYFVGDSTYRVRDHSKGEGGIANKKLSQI